MANVSKVSISHDDGSQESRNISGLAENIYFDNSMQLFNHNDLQNIIIELTEMIGTHDTAPDKMNKVNPTGSGAMSINRKTNTDIGEYSVAVGEQTTATGEGSFAEGIGTKATLNGSHAEGVNSEATGLTSHAEGSNTKASGQYSHTEGYKTVADGDYSHAGGNESSANGDYAFVHGNKSSANKDNSSALGNHLKTTVEDETVVGSYNELDPGYTINPSFVVGIGEDENTRKDGFVVLKDGTVIALKDIIIKNNGNSISLTGVNNKINEQLGNVQEVKDMIGTGYTTIGDTVSEAIINVYNKTLVEDEVMASEVTYNHDLSNLIANQVQAAIDELVSRSPFKFGMNEYGEYGYYKDGADTVTPFRTSTSGVPLERYMSDEFKSIYIGTENIIVNTLHDYITDIDLNGFKIDCEDIIHSIYIGLDPFAVNINAEVSAYQKIGSYVWTTEDKSQCSYNSDYVDADDCFKLKTEYLFDSSIKETIDEGSLFRLTTKVSKSNFTTMDNFVLTVSGCDEEFISDYLWENIENKKWNELTSTSWERNASFLIKAEDIYYTIKNGVLNELSISTLNAQAFKDNGFSVGEIKNIDLISELELPEIYLWDSDVEEEHILSLTMHGIPVPQVVISEDIILQQESIRGISSIVANEYTEGTEGSITFSFNPYGLTTWRIFLPDIGWGTLRDNELTGDTISIMNDMGSIAWNSTSALAYGEGLPRSVYQSFKMRFVLKSAEDSVTKVTVTYLNQD